MRCSRARFSTDKEFVIQKAEQLAMAMIAIKTSAALNRVISGRTSLIRDQSG